MPEKVIIIGSGPAAWSAAIYAARAQLSPLLFEGELTTENQMLGKLPMGQLALTTEVENYAGFPSGNLEGYLDDAIEKQRRQIMAPHQKEGVSGPELMELMRQQAVNFGTRVVTREIVEVDVEESVKRVTDTKGETYESHTLIVATGARANYLGLDSESRFKNRGVSACAVCDGALPRFRDQEVVVVGGGDSAVEEGEFMTKFASKVHVIHRRDELRASKIMANQLLENEKVEIHWNRVVEEVLGDDENGVTGVRIASTLEGDDKQETLEVAGMFLAIGHTPNTDFLKGKIGLEENGYITRTTPFRTNTTAEGVFVAGDAADDYYRQAITAAGTGCMAALDAERYLTTHVLD
jgi:thioredoxin reductase (NADPH)